MKNKNPFIFFFVILLALTLTGCNNSDSNGSAAPLNDKATLEKLASAYDNLSESLSTSPVSLRPEARKKFVVDVFKEAGFNYSATLEKLAETQQEEISQYHLDMKQLLFLPHHGFRLDDVKSIYSESEIKAIVRISEVIK